MIGFRTKQGLRRALVFFALAGVCSAPVKALAGQPLLIEFFGNSYKCSANKTVEREIEELLVTYPDAVLLNCRIENPPSVPDKEAFGRSYCNDARLGYFKELGLFAMTAPMVIVNGRYDANNNQLETAIKAALSLDEIKQISVSAQGEGLNIHIPEGIGRRKSGELYLYTYASFEKTAGAVVEGEQAIGSKAVLRFGETVVSGYKPFRPVVRKEKIADWNGAQLDLTYPIKAEVFPDYAGASLGYVVVLHERDLFSPVVAVGELPAPLVLYSAVGEAPALPLSEPVLKFVVPPDIPQKPPS